MARPGIAMGILWRLVGEALGVKVFCFFFSKKKFFLVHVDA
jgi:hypothetical protein